MNTKRRSRAGWRSAITALTTILVVALLPVVVPQPARAAASSPCDGITKYTPVPNSYVFPPWSDGSGWSNDDQFRTILNGDLDGDGFGELIGRNARTFEVYTWARGYGTGDKLYDPLPGQWTQVFPASGATVQTFKTEDGWWDFSQYGTFRLADLDGKAGDELIVRTAGGLNIYFWDATQRTFSPPIKTSIWSNTYGMGQSHYDRNATIVTGNVDGVPGDEVIARGPDGIETYSYRGGTLLREDQSPSIMRDFEPDSLTHWTEASYFLTIRTGDFDNDKIDELVGRSADGVELYDLDPTTKSWTKKATLTDWSDSAGWQDPKRWQTISVGDVNNDGRDDLVARSPFGIDARYVDATGAWKSVAPPDGFTDVEGYGDDENGLTVQVADVLPAPGAEVIGRADNGVITYALQNGKWTLQPGVIAAFSNANGFGGYTPDDHEAGYYNTSPAPYDVRFGTIRPVTVKTPPRSGVSSPASDPAIAGLASPQLIIGRDATGIRTYNADATSPSSPFPSYANIASVPIGTTNPLQDLDKLTPEQRAYWYINSVAARQYWTFESKTILEQFRNTKLSGSWAGLKSDLDQGSTNGSKFSPHGMPAPIAPTPSNGQPAQAMNVSRGTYNRMLQDVSDWTQSVNELYQFLLGTQGLQQMIEQSFVTNAGAVDDIKANFESNPQMIAVLSDLLWGLIGALGSVAFAFGASEAVIAFVSALASIVGSGAAAGLGALNPNASIDSTGDQLKQDIVNGFCAASKFIANAYDQAVQDYGLLTANREFVERSFDTSTAPAFQDATGAMTRSQKLWIWQRFANRDGIDNMWVGWCDFDKGTGCPWNHNDSNTWNSPFNDKISYKLIGETLLGTEGNCGYYVLENSSALKDLLPTGLAFAGPGQTDGPQVGRPAYVPAFGDSTPNNIGVQGWRLGTQRCDSDV